MTRTQASLFVVLALAAFSAFAQNQGSMRSGEVYGKVQEVDGRPAQASVKLSEQVISDGSFRLIPACSTTTAADGSFVCARLRPGHYLLEATRSVPQVPATTAQKQPVAERPTYFPNKSDVSQSDLIALSSNEEREAHIILAAPAKAVGIHGRLLGHPGRVLEMTTLLTPYGTSIRSTQLTYSPETGDWTLPVDSSNGTFQLDFYWWERGSTRHSVLRVDPEDRSQEHVTSEELTSRVHGVLADASTYSDISSTILVLEPQDRSGAALQSPISKDGSFDLGNVPVGRYLLRTTGSSEYVGSVVNNGVQTTASSVQVRAGAPDTLLNVSLRANAGIVSGCVDPTVDYSVLLRSTRTKLAMVTTIDAKGCYSFRDVPPGTYWLLAWGKGTTLSYREDSFWRRHSGDATTTEVHEGVQTIGDPGNVASLGGEYE